MTGERIQAFALEPQIDRDFDPVLFFFEKSPESNMNEFPRPSVYTPEGMLALRRAHLPGGEAGVGGLLHPGDPGGGDPPVSGRCSTWTPRGCELRKYRTQRPGRGYPSGRFFLGLRDWQGTPTWHFPQP